LKDCVANSQRVQGQERKEPAAEPTVFVNGSETVWFM